MPESFAPSWEYFTPDPEIAELFAESASGVTPLDSILSFDSDTAGRSRLSGMRVGTGNPDRGLIKLAPPRVHVARVKLKRRARLCLTCDSRFEPRYDSHVYCSVQCIDHTSNPNGGGHRVLPDAVCPTCRVPFRPLASRTKYCSRECVPWPTRVLPDRSCSFCSSSFRPSRSSRAYCSCRCAARMRAILRKPHPRPCERCSVPFPPSYRLQRFCSVACHNTDQHERSVSRRAAKPSLPHGRPRTLADIPCPACKTPFHPPESSQRYCSHSCAVAARKPRKINDERFIKLYLSSYTMQQIADEFRVTIAACQHARRRLGLAPRRGTP